MHKLGDVFHKLDSRRFFSLPSSGKTGHYTLQQAQNSHGDRHGSYSSSSSDGAKSSSSYSPLPVPKPSAASYPGCRSRPSSSPKHSPNFRSRLQPTCRRCNSQVDAQFMVASGCEQCHVGTDSPTLCFTCGKITRQSAAVVRFFDRVLFNGSKLELS